MVSGQKELHFFLAGLFREGGGRGNSMVSGLNVRTELGTINLKKNRAKKTSVFLACDDSQKTLQISPPWLFARI
jgi:hypothetical protein